MKIYTTCIVPILATFTLAEGALRITNKPNGAECTASSHCRSKCCSKVTRRSHICMSVEDGTNCVKNLRNVPGSGDDWIEAINEVRQEYQDEYGGSGTYTEIKWSSALAREAQSWANTVAMKCVNGVPGAESNADDYGVTTILNMRNPQMAVDRWVMNGLKARRVPSTASNPFTQMIWLGSEYVGCADATSSLSGTSCTASVCYYGYAGNCGWNRVADWRDAVVRGKKCSSTCPIDGNCSDLYD